MAKRKPKMTMIEARAIAQKRSPSSLAPYGLNRETYATLVYAAGWYCPLCDKPFTEGRQRPRVIDHEHRSGLTRGIVCRQCNDRIGYLHENVEWMARTVAYLNYPPAIDYGIHAVHHTARGKEQA